MSTCSEYAVLLRIIRVAVVALAFFTNPSWASGKGEYWPLRAIESISRRISESPASGAEAPDFHS
jgi:hypothetical protein